MCIRFRMCTKETVLCLNPLWQTGVGNERANPAMGQINANNKEWILAPACIHKCHWILGVIDVKKRRWSVYDPAQGGSTRAKYLWHNFTVEFEKTGFSLTGFAKMKLENWPTQKDMVNCGIFVTVMCLIAEDRRIEFIAEGIPRIRRVLQRAIFPETAPIETSPTVEQRKTKEMKESIISELTNAEREAKKRKSPENNSQNAGPSRAPFQQRNRWCTRR